MTVSGYNISEVSNHSSFKQNYILEDTDFTNEARELEKYSRIHQQTSIKIECDFCGDTTTQQKNQHSRSEHHFCKEGCRLEWLENRSGENSPLWKGGVNGYRGPSWNKQRQKAYDRDNGQCQDCGIEEEDHILKYGYRPHVHHTIPYRCFDDHETANQTSNLITLCTICHPKHERWANYVAQAHGFL